MTSNEKPLVSVIIPIYNMQEFLAETIESVLQSTYPRYELILVDDGSTDQSATIAQQFSSNHPNILFFAQPNGGVSNARNTALKHASGKYILPVDADNLISADYIEKAVDVLETDHDVKVVACEAVFFGDKKGAWELPPFSLELLARKNMLDNCSMYRKKDCESIGGYCNEILGCEDWDFWISMLKNGGKVVKLPIVGLFYRVRKDSLRKRTRHLKKDLITQLNKRHKAFFYKQINGDLHVSRTWSETYNNLVQFFNPCKVVSAELFEDFVYNIPEIFEKSTENSDILKLEVNGAKVEVHKFISKFTDSESAAKKAYNNCSIDDRIGYYEKRKFLCYFESYFVCLTKQN